LLPEYDPSHEYRGITMLPVIVNEHVDGHLDDDVSRDLGTVRFLCLDLYPIDPPHLIQKEAVRMARLDARL
jgi:hypothetical protein